MMGVKRERREGSAVLRGIRFAMGEIDGEEEGGIGLGYIPAATVFLFPHLFFFSSFLRE